MVVELVESGGRGKQWGSALGLRRRLCTLTKALAQAGKRVIRHVGLASGLAGY